MIESFRNRSQKPSAAQILSSDKGEDVVALHGPDGRFQSISGNAMGCFGLTNHALIDKSFMELVRPEHIPSVLQALARISQPDGPENARFRCSSHGLSAEAPALEVTFSRTRDGFRSVTRSIEHWLNREALIRQEAASSIEVATKRSEQLANFSHELRTPLNAVIGFAGAIHGQQFGPIENERYKDYARIICESSEHLMSLISDIVDLNKAEANETALNLETVSIDRLVHFCADLIRFRVEEADLSIEVSVAPGIRQARLDPKIMRQILLNLLSNALKFTESGGIAINVALDGDTLEFNIVDTGVGMSPDDLALVGTRFRQARQEGVRGTKGSGIGLALSKALARVHGGELTLQSDVGQGTTATLRIPYYEANILEDCSVHKSDNSNVIPLSAARA